MLRMLPPPKPSLKSLAHQGWVLLAWLQILATIGLIGGLFASPSSQKQSVSDRSHTTFERSTELSQWTTDELFTSPDAIGAIAIGVAEGTRTTNGGYTPLYFGHSDPGNGKHNLGTFAYQHGAYSPEEADRRQLQRINPWVTQLEAEAKTLGISLETFELVAGIDLMNQSPLAGKAYIRHLETCQDFSSKREEAVLCARIRSFVNPDTGRLEAGGLGSRFWVKRDQQRRIREIKKVLELSTSSMKN